MKTRFICNATWAPDGSIIDLILGTGESTSMSDGAGGVVGIQALARPAGELSAPEGAEIIDAKGQFVLPALCDAHATIKLPGQSLSKAVELASAAALKGGVWMLGVTPIESPYFDNTAALDSFADSVKLHSKVFMLPIGSISKEAKGEQQAPYDTLKARGIGMISDDEHIPTNMLMLHRAMKYVGELGLTMAIRPDVPALSKQGCMHPSVTSYRLGLHGVPSCAEVIGAETLMALAADSKVKLHLQNVSSRKTVERLCNRLNRKHTVTAEVTLHHLLFTHEDVGVYNTSFKTVPPLRDQEDTEALIQGVKDEVINCIVSDHRPCAEFAKKQDFPSAPQGMVMLDTYLPAIYTKLVKAEKLSWADVVRACCVKPCDILTGNDEADGPSTLVLPVILFNPEHQFTVTPEELPSGTLNSPFMGQELCGEVRFFHS